MTFNSWNPLWCLKYCWWIMLWFKVNSQGVGMEKVPWKEEPVWRPFTPIDPQRVFPPPTVPAFQAENLLFFIAFFNSLQSQSGSLAFQCQQPFASRMGNAGYHDSGCCVGTGACFCADQFVPRCASGGPEPSKRQQRRILLASLQRKDWYSACAANQSFGDSNVSSLEGMPNRPESPDTLQESSSSSWAQCQRNCLALVYASPLISAC